MPTRKYPINLSSAERERLTKLIKAGKWPARVILRANILLQSDAAEQRKPMTVGKLAAALQTTPTTVQNVRRGYAEQGLDAALNRKRRETPPVAPKVDGELEAHIIALCCGKPPQGYARWSLRLLADKCVELGYVDGVSHTTVSRTLKKRA
jgi:DNA-binding transcriptional ArsR family regulator